MAEVSDDNIADCWEEIDEDQLFNGIHEDTESVMKPVYHNGPIIIGGDDALRTQYLPPEPLVKILKRPCKERLSALTSEGTNGARLIKSLRQREAEYAQARQRIMGNTDENLNDNDRLEQVEASSSLSALQSPMTYTLLRPPVERLESNVVRLPRGPDGTAGFTIRR